MQNRGSKGGRGRDRGRGRGVNTFMAEVDEDGTVYDVSSGEKLGVCGEVDNTDNAAELTIANKTTQDSEKQSVIKADSLHIEPNMNATQVFSSDSMLNMLMLDDTTTDDTTIDEAPNVGILNTHVGVHRTSGSYLCAYHESKPFLSKASATQLLYASNYRFCHPYQLQHGSHYRESHQPSGRYTRSQCESIVRVS